MLRCSSTEISIQLQSFPAKPESNALNVKETLAAICMVTLKKWEEIWGRSLATTVCALQQVLEHSRGPTARPESSNTGVRYLGPSWLKLASWIPGTRYLLLEVETVKDEYPIGSSLSLAPVFPIPSQQLMVRVNFYGMLTMCQKPHLSNFQVSLI